MKATGVPKKQKYRLEFEIKCSPKILYYYISTADGFEGWFAHKVEERSGDFIFHWEGSEGSARMVSRRENQLVKFRWLIDGKRDENYFQFEIIQDDITSDVALIITDFTTEEEKEENILLWKSQAHALMHQIGS